MLTLGLLPLGMGSSCLEEAMVDPDIGRPAPPLFTTFIPPGTEAGIQLGGDTWTLVARDQLVSVGTSVDLWFQKGDQLLFAGLVPSCFGRSRTVEVPPGSGKRRSACHLDSFRVEGNQALAHLQLGGGWAQDVVVNLDDVVADPDRDGWSTALENVLGTRADLADTDGDGVVDPKDDNPLVAPPVVVPAPPALAAPKGTGPKAAPVKPTVASAVAAALMDVPGCVKGKPFLVMGPPELRQSFKGLGCQVFFLELGSSGASEALLLMPQQGALPRGTHILPEAARRGGINRVLVEGTLRGTTAVVKLHLLAGVSTRTLEWNGRTWDELSRDMQVATDKLPPPPPPPRPANRPARPAR